MNVEMIPIENLKEYENNPRKTKKIGMLEKSIERFGFINPVIAYKKNDGDIIIIAGHQRVQAAKEKNIKSVPVIFPNFKSYDEAKAYLIADNRTSEKVATWEDELLQSELKTLTDMDFLEFGNFDTTEQEQKIDEWEFTEIYEPFWLVIRGPIAEFKKYKNKLIEMSQDDTRIVINASHESSREDGYIVGWEKIRKEKLAKNPECEKCGSDKKLVVHHIKPILDGGDLSADENLQTLCRSCHEKAHGRKNEI